MTFSLSALDQTELASLRLEVADRRTREQVGRDAYLRLQGELHRERAAHQRLRAVADQSITDLQGIANLTDESAVEQIAEHIASSLSAALRGEPAPASPNQN